MITYACHPQNCPKTHLDALQARCKALKLSRPHLVPIEPEHSVVPVTVSALKVLRRGGAVTIVAALSTIKAPSDATSDYLDAEWREGWLGYLDTHNIPFHVLDTGDQEPTTIAKSSAIRSFRNAMTDLEARLVESQRPQRSATFYVCGRPPFGYRVEDRRLIVDKQQSADVTKIFSMIRAGTPIRDVVEAMQVRKGAAFWDRKKVSRILAHASLYCEGIYAVRGVDVVLPQLVFLPRDWIDTGVPPATAAGTMAGPGA